MRRFTKEAKIGLAGLVGIVLLFFGMNFLKGILILSNDVAYNIKFKSVNGLSSSSPIYADGFKVGVVRGVDFDYEKHEWINVRVDLNKELRIPKGSTAEISSDFMGNTQINLILANSSENIEPGGTIEGIVDNGIMAKAKDIVPMVEQMLPKMDSILVSVNTLLQDPAISQSLHNVEDITANLKVSTTQLNALMSQVNGKLPSMMSKADNVLDNAGQMTANLAQLDVAATMAKVNETIENVNAFTEALNSNEGTFGRLMRDPSLYNDMTGLMHNADSLMIDLKSHPKRYVHFSIFGRKDK